MSPTGTTFLALGDRHDVSDIVHLAGIAREDADRSLLPHGHDDLLNALDAARTWEVHRFAVASSLGVYVGRTEVPWHENLALPTAALPHLIVAFKKSVEPLTTHSLQGSGIQPVVLRIGTVWGPLGRPRVAVLRTPPVYARQRGSVSAMTTIGDHLVGRTAEMAAVDDALGAIRDGHAACLVVEGEPGIGKTRLLAELAARADARGCTVLAGSASELERDLPFWVFVDALDEYVASLDPQLVASLGDDVRVELGQVLPSLAGHAADGGPVLQDERYRAHRAVRELLERLAVRRPLVLTLDDVHWADPASVELLAALLRSPPGAAVLLVVAGRPRQLPERLAGGRAPRRTPGRGDPSRADRSGARGRRRSARRAGRPRTGRRAVRRLGRQPVLPAAARARGRRRRRRRAAGGRRAGGGGRPARGHRLARGGARAPLRRHALGAARRGRLGGPVRARPRRGGRRRQRRDRDGRVRRAARPSG